MTTVGRQVSQTVVLTWLSIPLAASLRHISLLFNSASLNQISPTTTQPPANGMHVSPIYFHYYLPTNLSRLNSSHFSQSSFKFVPLQSLLFTLSSILSFWSPYYPATNTNPISHIWRGLWNIRHPLLPSLNQMKIYCFHWKQKKLCEIYTNESYIWTKRCLILSLS
jgi:hypothetical protein